MRWSLSRCRSLAFLVLPAALAAACTDEPPAAPTPTERPAALAVAAADAVQTGVTTGAVTDLEVLPGDITSLAVDVNDRGQVVGTSAGRLGAHAFLWTPTTPNGTTGTMLDLGSLYGSAYADAQGINARGQVVGATRQPAPEGGERTVAYLWSPTAPNGTAGTMVDLNVPQSEARDINSAGQVVGSYWGPREDGLSIGPRAFLWTPAQPNGSSGQMVDLGSLTGELTFATAINDRGQVAGGSAVGVGSRPFLWTPSTPNGARGTMVELGPLPAGYAGADALDINAYGQVVGVGYTADSKRRAFLWTPTVPNGGTGTLVDLGHLGGGEANAFAINDAGQVAGDSRLADGHSIAAFRWTPTTPNGTTGTMQDLGSLGGLLAGNYTFSSGRGINGPGQVVGLSWTQTPTLSQHAALWAPRVRTTPTIVWYPAPVVFGAALGPAQLNAVAVGAGGAPVAGTYAYAPAAGTVLGVGTHQLSVQFSPADPASYAAASGTAAVAVRYNTAVGHRFLEPLAAAGAWQPNRPLTVAFQLFRADNVTPVRTATATLTVARVLPGGGTAAEPVVPHGKGGGTTFGYDPKDEAYTFKLDTKDWAAGATYVITASLDDGSTITATVLTRSKKN